MDEVPETLARADGVAGEIVLRRRACTSDTPVYELIVNGIFLMDSAETSTERLLAEIALQRLPEAHHVLVGGLGLGFTTATLLESPTIQTVTVAELEPLLVDWLRDDVVPGARAIMTDARVDVVVADVREVLETPSSDRYDIVLLDVDNGPDFLVRDVNAELYRAPLLRLAGTATRPGGIVAVWSAAQSQPLADALAETIGPVDVVQSVVTREGRDVDYYVYVATAEDMHRATSPAGIRVS